MMKKCSSQVATFADLLDALPALNTNSATRRDYHYAISRCVELYGVKTLKDLPLESLDAFDRRFPRNGFTPELPFPSEGSYLAWRRKVRVALKKYIEPETYSISDDAPNDEWTTLITMVKAELERQQDSPLKLIGLNILAKYARKQGIKPESLTPVVIDRLMNDLTPKQREYYRATFSLLEKLRGGSLEIASYLPSTQLLPPSKNRNLAPPNLLEEAKDWVDGYCLGEYDEIEEIHGEERSEKTRSNYLTALRAYLNTASAASLITGNETLSDAMRKNIFVAVMRQWIKPTLSKNLAPRTMVSYVKRIKIIAHSRGVDVTHMTDALKKNRQLKTGKLDSRNMADGSKNFCRWLLSDRKNIISFMSMHVQLLKRAQNLIEAEQYRKLSAAEENELVQLGSIAAMVAIWLWITPLRISNMLRLTISGAQRKLHLPQGKRDYALLLIPKDETKTKRPIRKKVYRNKSRSLEVIAFYIDHIRSRHPLAATSPLLFPGYRDVIDPISTGSTLKWLRRACRKISFYQMKSHWFRHGIASVFLKRNPGAYVHAGRMLDDTPRTVRDYYGFIDDEQLLNEAQVEMLKIAGFVEEEPADVSSLREKW